MNKTPRMCYTTTAELYSWHMKRWMVTKSPRLKLKSLVLILKSFTSQSRTTHVQFTANTSAVWPSAHCHKLVDKQTPIHTHTQSPIIFIFVLLFKLYMPCCHISPSKESVELMLMIFVSWTRAVTLKKLQQSQKSISITVRNYITFLIYTEMLFTDKYF